jgi:hypothetical protein
MARTPEARVKEKIKKLLKTHDVWHFLPVSNGLGKHGIPDFICCAPTTVTKEMVGQKIGMFVGIEAKATEKHQPTERQAICLREIHQSNGAALVVNKDNIPMLEAFLEGL